MLADSGRAPDQSAAASQAASVDLTIPADDGWPLAATLFTPSPGPAPQAPLTVIAGGTGISRRYYARLATWLAEHGRPVLVFDYRDTGGSRSGQSRSLRGSQVRMRDWCIRDVPGVIAWAGRAHAGRPLHWLGHSLGGFATGLAHNGDHVARQLNIGTLSGYWRHMAVPERYRVRVLMGAVAPLVIGVLGYFPGALLGGEDMPGPAFLEWRRWCMSPGFLFDDPTLSETANFPRFRAPVRFGQVEDDPWGTPAAVAAIAAHFTGSVDRALWHIRLADAGARRIGHHGFFKAEHRATLWPAALEWLEG